ncbi:2-amino-4-hydroxy-6-hydroxymethyldihydropteridine diphosphokinase [Anaeromassilibacillus senegalensis]|uniref:2-amino-4-hydroxy-6-hydroxymethyldihydropteridine diphosphokinase n=1 Tax=Anaeromassilibacillus senegalensis TaxID=1673717 RepID=A0ABS9CMJ8_9FIRM|nr:2-amino-4-hydroxy-6-hydroxymethyldihydropteridine diphosphokinase [Anaeromassilibacillus senegalensis]MCF2652386.1 2-amino-4-hydroxy-6-hydroxymethyldihydropteridine diphosphokinase [Anaeromassilibacillus senegalensis]
MSRAVLGLGTNLGDRAENLRAALGALGRLPGTRVEAVSSVWQTAPFDVPDKQQDYWNICVSLETTLSPHALLGACLGVEAALGRVRRTYHGARVIDLDLLLYDGAAVQEKELTVPHPGMLERAFVLFPLSELFPERIACGLDFHNAPGFADGGSVLRLGPAKDLLS